MSVWDLRQYLETRTPWWIPTSLAVMLYAYAYFKYIRKADR